MIVYSVTIKIEKSVQNDWLHWMNTVHINDVMKTGLFVSYSFLRLLDQDEDGGETYSIQYRCASRDKLAEYESIHAPALRNEHMRRYKDKFIAFRTVLEEIG